MHAPPQNVVSSFRTQLAAKQIGARYEPHYLKWLRYYWDFCVNNHLEPQEGTSLEPFIDKLSQKGQGAGLQSQARKAVRVFYELPSLTPRHHAQRVRSVTRVGRDQTPPPKVPMTPLSATSKSTAFQHPGDSGLSADWRQALNNYSNEIKVRHYSPKTLSSYAGWVKRFAVFHEDKAPKEMSVETARAFLTDLAVRGKVAASTQNQAFNALLFLYRHILKCEFELGDSVVRAKTTKYIPTVLNHEELERVLENLTFPFHLVVSVLYGCGLRHSECLNLRVNSLDFDQELVIVHDGKGKKDRSVPMPKKLKSELQAQVERVAKLLERDLQVADFGGVFLPQSIANKSSRVATELQWQWLFPAKMLTLVPDEGCYRRYHNYDKHVGSAIRAAVRKAKIPKRVTAHTFRHTFASHLLRANVDLRTIQQMLGHSDIRTTMIYTHTVQSRTKKEMVSPLDL